MSDIQSSLLDLGAMDQLARQETAVHRLDPRAKILAGLAFVAVTVSFGRYEISALLPMVFFPVFLGAAGRIPAGVILRKLLLALPFVLFVGLFNPLLDREALLRIGGLTISGGWVSFLSILLRSALTLCTALLLIAVTGMPALCSGMERLGAPRIFAAQLLFLHRYLFVLVEEALRMLRARSLRSFGRRGTGLRVVASMLGHLLLRTLDRAERVYHAMQSRGFTGEVRVSRPMSWGRREAAFLLGWCLYFTAARTWNLPRLVGALATGGAG